jgi:hypothetical protein
MLGSCGGLYVEHDNVGQRMLLKHAVHVSCLISGSCGVINEVGHPTMCIIQWKVNSTVQVVPGSAAIMAAMTVMSAYAYPRRCPTASLAGSLRAAHSLTWLVQDFPCSRASQPVGNRQVATGLPADCASRMYY